MRQKTKNDRNQGSNAKNVCFCFVPKSPTQMSSLSAKNASKKFSRLGTFMKTYRMSLISAWSISLYITFNVCFCKVCQPVCWGRIHQVAGLLRHSGGICNTSPRTQVFHSRCLQKGLGHEMDMYPVEKEEDIKKLSSNNRFSPLWPQNMPNFPLHLLFVCFSNRFFLLNFDTEHYRKQFGVSFDA